MKYTVAMLTFTVALLAANVINDRTHPTAPAVVVMIGLLAAATVAALG